MRGEVMDMALGCLWGVAKVAAAAQLVRLTFGIPVELPDTCPTM
jgi:predicted cobalt transporter CbtA